MGIFFSSELMCVRLGPTVRMRGDEKTNDFALEFIIFLK